MARTIIRKSRNWQTLAGSEEGGDLVRIRMRPVTHLEYEMAINRAKIAMRKLHESDELRVEYGLDELPPDFVEEGEEVVSGVSTTLLATEVALISADEIEGYVDEDGEALAFSRRNVALVMGDWSGGRSMAQRFLERALVSVYRMSAEGKRSATAPNGPGAVAMPSAGAAGT